MLIFGLSWVASSLGVGLPQLPPSPSQAFSSSQAVGPQIVAQIDEAPVEALDKAMGLDESPALASSTDLAAATASSAMSLLGAPALAAALTPATLPPATLLPNWLSSQSSILNWAAPVTRWLSAATPLSTPPEDEAEADRVPAEMISQEHLVCSELDEATINETVIQEDGTPKYVRRGRDGSAEDLTATNAEIHQYENFSTWLRDCLLGKMSDRQEAESLAVRIEETLTAASFQGEAIEPTLVEGLPAAKMGDRTLFVVTEDISYDLQFNAEVVATKWVNKLRLALGASPLHLVESQMKMWGLKPTGEFLSGEASWYGPYFQGRLTATGEIFDKAMFTAAHKTLPFDTFLKVTNLMTGSVLVIRINDRGPYVGDRVLDLSQGAAQYLGSPDAGLIPFRAEFLEQENPLQASLPYRAMEPSQDPLITMWRP